MRADIRILVILFGLLLTVEKLRSGEIPSSLQLHVGQKRVFGLLNVRSIRVSNSRLLEIKRFPRENKIVLYGIAPGRTEMVIKYHNDRPPRITTVVINSQSRVREQKMLDQLKKGEKNLSVERFEDVFFITGIVRHWSTHARLKSLSERLNMVLNYRFHDHLCRQIEAPVVARFDGHMTFDPCLFYAKNKSDIKDIMNIYGSGLQVVVMEKRIQLVENTLIWVVSHAQERRKTGLHFSKEVPLTLRPLDWFLNLRPRVQALLSRGHAAVVTKHIVIGAHDETITFRGGLSGRSVPPFDVDIKLHAVIGRKQIITTQLSIASQAPMAQSRRHKNDYQTVLNIRAGRAHMVSHSLLRGDHLDRNGIALISEIPIIGYFFRNRNQRALVVTVALVLKQDIIALNE